MVATSYSAVNRRVCRFQLADASHESWESVNGGPVAHPRAFDGRLGFDEPLDWSKGHFGSISEITPKCAQEGVSADANGKHRDGTPIDALDRESHWIPFHGGATHIQQRQVVVGGGNRKQGITLQILVADQRSVLACHQELSRSPFEPEG